MPFAPTYRVRTTAGPLRPIPTLNVPAVVISRVRTGPPPVDYAPAPLDRDDTPREQPGPRGGKLLCDEAGRLYEWAGDRLHPLQPSELGRKPQAAPGPAFRALCPEPGIPLVVRWPEFRRLLEPHIAYPERLRGTHHLAVHVQVYEAMRPQRVGELAQAALGAPDRARELAPLTPPLAERLGLQGRIPPAPESTPTTAGREWLAAGERVIRMTPASDPTAIAAARPRVAPEPPSPPAEAGPAAHPAGVPEAFGRPWEFRVSREEAQDEMDRARGAVGRLRSLLGRVLSPGRRRDRRRWALRLAGRTLEEQLWAVRPPRGALGERLVRDWAHRTLERAGYDARTMLDEWELYWRRKGA